MNELNLTPTQTVPKRLSKTKTTNDRLNDTYADKNELDVDYSTLKRWERAGLRRYSPPIEDILIFLGADK